MKKLLLLFTLFCFTNLFSKTIYVNSSVATSGDGSSGSPYKTFKEAYDGAVNGDIINLTGIFTWGVGGEATRDFEITKGITIQGPSGGLAAIEAATSMSSETLGWIFNIKATVTIKNLELRNAYRSSGSGGAIAISAGSKLTVLNCYIHDNSGDSGGGISVFGTLIMTNSTVSSNVCLTESDGGAGIYVNNGSIEITNSTICKNTDAPYGGGINIVGSNSTAVITNCTIACNSSTDCGGGISIDAGTLTIKNSIVANNTEATSSNNGADFDHYGGNINDNGYNIIQYTNSGSITKTSDISSLNLSSTLADNGTLTGTPTLAITSSSIIVINNGSSAANGTVSIPTTDQRGATRPDAVDIGAYEYNGVLPVELTSFTASLVNEGVQLNWATATEVNNYGFDIQRSVISGQQSEWETIGFVEGHGNSNSPKQYEFIDETAPGGDLEYRLKQIDTDGNYEYYSLTTKVDNSVTAVEDVKELPEEYLLLQNYPNPFNPTTVISYQLSTDSKVQLKVYDMLGKEVATLVNREQSTGNYNVNFNASKLSSGTYIYKITAGDFVDSKKMVILK